MTTLDATELRIDAMTVDQAAAILREVVRDKSYTLLPLGQEVALYLRHKRKRLTDASYRDYESILDKFARYFPTGRLEDFEPPTGTMRIEEFLDDRWGGAAPRTYNKALSVVTDFFKFQRRRGRMVGDPTDAVERAKKREVYRSTFSTGQMRQIIAGQDNVRDRLALRLLLNYGLRKGALTAIQFRHFDHVRKRLTIFTKGQTIREVPIPDAAFWHDLERLILDVDADPGHYLMPRVVGNGKKVTELPDKPKGVSGMHRWWYRCLANAGVVPEGTTAGERMHKARHTAGQRLLDTTGNLVAVKNLLGHASIKTTADSYVDWDIEQLNDSLAAVLAKEDE